MVNKKTILTTLTICLLLQAATTITLLAETTTQSSIESYQFLDGTAFNEVQIYTSAYDSIQQQKGFTLSSNIQTQSLSKGWPVTLDTFAVLSSPAAYDFDNDGTQEIVVTTYGVDPNPYGSGKIYVLTSSGDIASGWPIVTPGPCPASPAIADLNNDGVAEIVTTCWYNVYVLHYDGSIVWEKYESTVSSTTPVLTDLDEDGNLDIIISGRTGKIHAWSYDGTYLSGWPVQIDPTYQYELSTPVVCDFDNDDKIEIIVNTEDDKTYVFNHDGTVLSGWPITVPGDPEPWANVNRPPVVGDIDGDGNIELIRDGETQLFVYENDGTIVSGWPQTIRKYSNNGFALGQINDDGNADIVFGRTEIDGELYAFSGDGTSIAGFPVLFTSKTITTPCIIADLDDDSDREIIARSQEEVYMFHHDGTIASGWPKSINDDTHTGSFSPTPLITDLEGDGILELIVASCHNTVHMFPLTGTFNVNTLDWPTFQHDVHRSGLYQSLSNVPPNPPTIDGPTNGNAGETYTYTFVVDDNDGDQIQLLVDWGDNTTTDWIGPYDPQEPIELTHTWDEQGTYQIKAKAKDSFGAQSDWATLDVTMPVNHPIISIIYQLIQNFMQRPVIAALLGILLKF